MKVTWVVELEISDVKQAAEDICDSIGVTEEKNIPQEIEQCLDVINSYLTNVITGEIEYDNIALGVMGSKIHKQEE